MYIPYGLCSSGDPDFLPWVMQSQQKKAGGLLLAADLGGSSHMGHPVTTHRVTGGMTNTVCI